MTTDRINKAYDVKQQIKLVRVTRLPQILILACGCFGSQLVTPTPVPSPSGAFLLKPSVNQSKSDPAKRGCVLFEVTDANGARKHSVQTGTSDYQKWAIGWFDDSTIVLYSSDTGVEAWNIDPDGSIVQTPAMDSDELIAFGKKLKSFKYGP